MNAVFPSKNRLLIGLLANLLLAGCTSLQSHTAIEPYTKNKTFRNEIEIKAEEFCKAKRATASSGQPVKQPDYIYTTDGCSRWPDDSWLACCVVHDISYWCGGSEIDRQQADRELERCVNNRTSMMGSIMYIGVQIGGAPWLPTPWRWGYGWDDWPRDYEKLGNSPSVMDLIEKLEIYKILDKQLPEVNK